MPPVRVHGGGLRAGGEPLIAYGFNYTGRHRDGMWILRYFDQPSRKRLAVVRRGLNEQRRMGANTVRIFLELGQFMRSSRSPDRRALAALDRVLALAERKGLYVDVTGNLNWRPWARTAWYDRLPERTRWRVQQRFWRAVAAHGRRSRSVLCYELGSEPTVPLVATADWYTGSFGGYEFVENIVLDPGGRDPSRLALSWTRRLAEAVRSRDRRHPVSIGLLPFPAPGFAPENVAPVLDLLIVHEYPVEGFAARSIEVMRRFAAPGLPLLLGETAQLFGGRATEREFLLGSRPWLDGYLSHYDGRRPAEVVGDSAADSAYLSTLTQFLRLRGTLLRPGR